MPEYTSLIDLSYSQLEELLADLGEPKYRAKQLFSWIHEKRAKDIAEMTNLPNALRDSLKQSYPFLLPKVERMQEASDGTKKFLFSFSDGARVETVLMRYHYGLSVCVSTQVGCRMGCSFCASGMDGLVRNLSAGEIVGQVYAAGLAACDHVSHIVFMGMGEPFDNYENVLKSIRLLNDERGAHISVRNMTVSTCGIVERIYDFAKEELGVTLSLSLHATSDEGRKAIMPVAKRYSLDEVIEACRYYERQTKRRITYEYCLIPGTNDTDEDVKRMAALLSDSRAHVNLIGVHAVAEKGQKKADKKALFTFKNKLEKKGINVTIRRDLGAGIDGACGQLRLRDLKG